MHTLHAAGAAQRVYLLQAAAYGSETSLCVLDIASTVAGTSTFPGAKMYRIHT